MNKKTVALLASYLVCFVCYAEYYSQWERDQALQNIEDSARNAEYASWCAVSELRAQRIASQQISILNALLSQVTYGDADFFVEVFRHGGGKHITTDCASYNLWGDFNNTSGWIQGDPLKIYQEVRNGRLTSNWQIVNVRTGQSIRALKRRN